jgi:hypothetical protein
MNTLRSFFNAGLLRQASLLEAMTSRLRLHLPTQIAQHCWVGGVRNRTLVVITDSASFAVAAYYRQHDILKRINADFQTDLPAPLIRLKTKVAKRPSATKKPWARPTLSTDNARGIKSVAVNIADSELKSALNKLARRGTKHSQP